jgi:hypothetical protein
MPPAAAQQLRGGQGLHCLTQAHVIGQNHAAAAGRENGAPLLVGEQLRLQQSVQGILPAVKLGEKLAFQVESLREFIFPVEVFEHVAVDDRFAVGLAESLDHPMKTPEVLPQQQPGWIEKLLGELTECGRRNRRQAQADIDRFAVLQRNGGARARIRLAFELVAVPFPKAQQKRLDVLASAQGVDGEVRARAVVFEQPRPAHGHPVSFPAGGLHAIVAVRLPAWPFQNLGDGIARPFPPLGNLLLD